jgi:hypothetical protein
MKNYGFPRLYSSNIYDSVDVLNTLASDKEIRIFLNYNF